MPRRVNLPGANELFRGEQPRTAKNKTKPAPSQAAVEPVVNSTGRVRHSEKITVYVSTEELIALDQARLTLRAEHQIAVDRGRVVREAIDLVLADLAARGADSELVKRLTQP